MAYVKYSDVYDSVDQIVHAIEAEPDTIQRGKAISLFLKAVSTAAEKLLERQVYAMKELGIATDMIAIDLGISQRAVVRLIRSHSKKVGHNPLERTHIDSWFDVRDYVDLSGRKTIHPQTEEPTPESEEVERPWDWHTD